MDFSLDPRIIAPQLLGCELRANGVTLRLTEVEAYCGAIDPGSHAYRKLSPRNAPMFEAPGHLYVYFTYGMHHCMNIVCWPEGEAGAVLLRAGEVIEGQDTAKDRRPAAKRERDLARGPANLVRALAIGPEDNRGAFTFDGELADPHADPSSVVVTIRSRSEVPEILSGPRVGVSGPGGDADAFPWRYWIAGDPTVSAFKPGKR